jgi:hypothetical protein
MISRPTPDEYAQFYSGYVARVPEGGDVLGLLQRQPQTLADLLKGTSNEQAAQRPAPNEWSIKEVIGHLNDSERIFGYRALRFSRRDPAPLPGFEQDDYVREGSANSWTLGDLLEEFAHLRAANVLLFKHLPEDRLMLLGEASRYNVSVRALVYITAGHVEHHLESLRTVYLK